MLKDFASYIHEVYTLITIHVVRLRTYGRVFGCFALTINSVWLYQFWDIGTTRSGR